MNLLGGKNIPDNSSSYPQARSSTIRAAKKKLCWNIRHQVALETTEISEIIIVDKLLCGSHYADAKSHRDSASKSIASGAARLQS